LQIVAVRRPRGSRESAIQQTAPYSPSARHLAACERLAREPGLLDAFGPDDWVAFGGEEIVASGPDYAEVVRAAAAAGEDDPLIVPVMGDLLIGGNR
jgi:hypothetical protein